jgi:hypothetical protein
MAEGMTITRMTVTDSYGQIAIYTEDGTMVRDLRGSHGYCYDGTEKGAPDSYRFWAIGVPNIIYGDPESLAATLRPHKITMTMPLGGVFSGLYRYPKIGETVLICRTAATDAEYYMMGYVPSRGNPFNAIFADQEGSKRIFEEEGEILRYSNTAHGDNLYSEIGFYKAEKAQWPKTEGKTDFPPIDVLVLDSAGNIRETAANHHLQTASRIEILADTPEVLDRKTNAVDSVGTLPLGEYLGDDASLHRGDIHIRAGNRVVIKADQEIRLQVGRTTMRIDDTGFNVVTKNVTGNYTNSYDTMLNMTARNGIDLTGKNINLKAGYRFNAGDGMGGTVATTMGNLKLGGREVNIESYNNTEYMFYTIYQGLEYLVNAASGGMALNKADIQIADYLKFSEDNLEALIKIARKASALWAKRKEIVKQKEAERAAAAAAAAAAERLRREELMRAMEIDPNEALEKDAFIAKYGQELYDALVVYSGPDYQAMNAYLRGTIDASQLSPELLRHIQNIQDFFHNKTNTEEMTVYRFFCVYPGFLDGLVSGGTSTTDPAVADVATLIGKEVTNASFLSTSTEDQDGWGSFALDSTVKLILTLPQGGDSGINITGISSIQAEKEYLIPPGYTYKITYAQQNVTTHKLEIYATVMRNET